MAREARLEHELVGALDDGLERVEELRGLGAVDDAVICGQAHVHHLRAGRRRAIVMMSTALALATNLCPTNIAQLLVHWEQHRDAAKHAPPVSSVTTLLQEQAGSGTPPPPAAHLLDGDAALVIGHNGGLGAADRQDGASACGQGGVAA